jgi:hypothetical protein
MSVLQETITQVIERSSVQNKLGEPSVLWYNGAMKKLKSPYLFPPMHCGKCHNRLELVNSAVNLFEQKYKCRNTECEQRYKTMKLKSIYVANVEW